MELLCLGLELVHAFLVFFLEGALEGFLLEEFFLEGVDF